MQKTFDLEILREEIRENWQQEFGGKDYFDIFLDGKYVFGVRYWSNKGDTENIELRHATKYEISIEDIYRKLAALLMQYNANG